jgi:hypothetical protein
MRSALLTGSALVGAALLGALAACGSAPPLPDPATPPALLSPAPVGPPPVATVPPVPSTTAGASPTAAPSVPAPRTRPAPAAEGGAERPAAVVEPTGKTLSTLVTYYAAYDNDPPGSRAIAYPNARHPEAGGTGTFDDPLTLATDPRELAVGTVVYYPAVRKYFVMEDLCASCVQEWDAGRTFHIDLWSGAATDSGVTACQEALTPDGRVTVELDPPPGRPVDTAPFYEDGVCLAG